MKSFEQQCVLLNVFLKKIEHAAQCSFIGMNDTDSNSQCLYNAKKYFLIRYHQKTCYQDAVLV